MNIENAKKSGKLAAVLAFAPQVVKVFTLALLRRPKKGGPSYIGAFDNNGQRPQLARLRRVLGDHARQRQPQPVGLRLDHARHDGRRGADGVAGTTGDAGELVAVLGQNALFRLQRARVRLRELDALLALPVHELLLQLRDLLARAFQLGLALELPGRLSCRQLLEELEQVEQDGQGQDHHSNWARPVESQQQMSIAKRRRRE